MMESLTDAQKSMCGRPVWTPPPVQEESLDSCGAGSGAAMCPASAAAAHVWTPPPVQEGSLDSCGAGSGAAMCPASAAAAHEQLGRPGVGASVARHGGVPDAASGRVALAVPPRQTARA